MPYFSGGMPENTMKVTSSKPPTTRPAITPYFRMVRNMVLLLGDEWSCRDKVTEKVAAWTDRLLQAEGTHSTFKPSPTTARTPPGIPPAAVQAPPPPRTRPPCGWWR